MTTTAGPITQLGPYRALGLSYIAGNGNFDFPGVWEKHQKLTRGRFKTDGVNCFGICRCIAGVTDGTWEYIAAIEVPNDVAVPDGLMEVNIPRADYVIIEAEGLKEIGNAWNKSREAVAALSGYEPYCGPKGCECATHPAFERYDADFARTNKVMICTPVRESSR